MQKAMIKAFLGAAIILGIAAPSRSFCVGDIEFEIPGVELTYSEDGRKIVLPLFFLQLFETDGDITLERTYLSIERALDDFMLAELNAVYAPLRTVNKVSSKVYSDQYVLLDNDNRHLLPQDKRIQPSQREKIEWEMNHGSLETLQEETAFLRGKRSLYSVVGSQLLMSFNVTFERSPTPTDEEVARRSKFIMRNLQYFVKNLTATGDEELIWVYMAIRKEIETIKPSAPASNTKEPIMSPPSYAPFNPSIIVIPTYNPSSRVPVEPTRTPTKSGSNGNVTPPTKVPIAPSKPSTSPDGGESPQAQTSQPVASPVLAPIAPTPVKDPTRSPTTSGNVSPPTKVPVAPSIPSKAPDGAIFPHGQTSQPAASPILAPIVPTPALVPTRTPTSGNVSPPTKVPFAPVSSTAPDGGLSPDEQTNQPAGLPTSTPISPTPFLEPTRTPTTSGSDGNVSPPTKVPVTPSEPSMAPDGGTSPNERTNQPLGSPSMYPFSPSDTREPTSESETSLWPSGVGGIPTDKEVPGIDMPGGSEPTSGVNDNGERGMIVGAVIGSAAAVFVVVAAILLIRRRRNDDEERSEAADLAEEGRNNDYFAFLHTRRQKTRGDSPSEDSTFVPRSPAVTSSPMSHSKFGDSVFSGLTDILADTGSPRIRPVKSMSSATTVRANNVASSPLFSKSPISTANGSALFAFSEGDDEEEDEDRDTRINFDQDGDPLAPTSETSNKGENEPIGSLAVSQSSPVPSGTTGSLVVPQSSSSQIGISSMIAGGAAVVAALGAAATCSAPDSKQTTSSDERPARAQSASPCRSVASAEGAFPTGRKRSNRHHAGKGIIDGTSEYQEAMHPMDWSYKSNALEDEQSISSSEEKVVEQYIFSPSGERTKLFSPRSERSKLSSISGNTTPASRSSGVTEMSANRQLINDLMWLEQKIADVRTIGNANASAITPMSPVSPGFIEHADSLSYASKDAVVSPSSHDETTTIDSNGIMQNIVCRDCFAPPGKLQIVIHSTKDGPAVHAVKAGSSLEGHLFAGDLIIAVDNVDTRTFQAEDVMKMMASKSGFERKITVLHFES